MNKIGMVLGLAAVAAVAGCKDPNYQRKHAPVGEVKSIGTEVAPAPEAVPAQTGTPIVVEERHCTCPPGTKHVGAPCPCGAPDCQCEFVAKPVVVKPLPPPEPEYTVYIVQRGDYLAKISKKYNVTINSIKRLNNLKDDNIRIGQKLKLPGKIDVGEQKVPEGAFAKPPAKAASANGSKAYEGPTKEYVVKSGDTLGAIAYGNGINIRQLKALNGLTSDSLKIGQKLKIPAEKVVSAPAPTVDVAKADAKKPATAAKKAEEKAEKAAEPVEAVDPQPVDEAPRPVAEEAAGGPTYTVQEGDDLTGVSIRWGVSAAAILELNNLGENDKLVPGQILKLPPDAQQQ
jgi:LysM repeat protein